MYFQKLVSSFIIVCLKICLRNYPFNSFPSHAPAFSLLSFPPSQNSQKHKYYLPKTSFYFITIIIMPCWYMIQSFYTGPSFRLQEMLQMFASSFIFLLCWSIQLSFYFTLEEQRDKLQSPYLKHWLHGIFKALKDFPMRLWRKWNFSILHLGLMPIWDNVCAYIRTGSKAVRKLQLGWHHCRRCTKRPCWIAGEYW